MSEKPDQESKTEEPTEKKIRELAEPWRPHRGAAAIFAWHHRHVVPV